MALFNKDKLRRKENRSFREDIPDETPSNRFLMENPARKAIIYQSELDYISCCILDYPEIETGGQLFGFWTATGVPVVLYTIGPGKNSRHNVTSFIQDQDYLQTIGNQLYKRYRLQHIGEWHSHHQLGLAYPSGGDVHTMSYGVGKPGFPRLLLCIGNCNREGSTVNPFIFHENTPGEYSEAAWDVVNIESPFRPLIDSELASILIHPNRDTPVHGFIKTYDRSVSSQPSIMTHWLTESSENIETMKKFVSMTQALFPEYHFKTMMNDNGEPMISVEGLDISILLPYGFPSKSPLIVQEGEEISSRHDWEIGEEPLTLTFGRWVSENLSKILK